MTAPLFRLLGLYMKVSFEKRMEMDGAKIAGGMRTCADAVARIEGGASRIRTSAETSAVKRTTA